ncbi:hypothetical protein DFQ10_102498 [Winogradskyella eximia]|uniref:DUF4265 domain-containing protein n=1 Tax=Winogradskyella eximia TaxID=262006 RepID=A0A3D9H808_9FLAO|nr:hypothetical protein [Winogradskyella eximia]RED45622.1 hypothetical protein DFQ10_102498 [Winogradskyella eximia]
METEEIKIFVYDKREKITSSCYVEQISENKFRMTENDLFNCHLTKGTEFKTRLNEDGNHEVVKILKKSEFITRRFLLSTQYKESDYRVLGDELMKRGGFWQVDFGGIATVNIPKDFEFNIDQVMKELDLNLTEITE